MIDRDFSTLLRFSVSSLWSPVDRRVCHHQNCCAKVSNCEILHFKCKKRYWNSGGNTNHKSKYPSWSSCFCWSVSFEAIPKCSRRSWVRFLCHCCSPSTCTLAAGLAPVHSGRSTITSEQRRETFTRTHTHAHTPAWLLQTVLWSMKPNL